MSSTVPTPSHGYLPPLPRALARARQALEQHQGANIHDHNAMVTTATAYELALRQLVDVIDSERLAE